MSNMRHNVIAIALAALVGWTGAQAAQGQPAAGAFIRDLKGEVLINTGKNYVPANAGDSLTIGSRVLVKEGGDATVVLLADGCEIHVGPGKMYEYRGEKCGAAVVQSSGTGAIGAAGGTGAISATTLGALGVLAVGGIVGGILGSEDDGNKKECQDPPSCSRFE